jgi:hypothetical protein
MKTGFMNFAKKSLFFGVLSFAIFLGSAVNAVSDDGTPFRSLNDLPQVWSGVAGDFLTRATANLRFGKAVEKSRSSTGQGFLAEYELQGVMSVGQLKYSIHSAAFWVDDEYPNRAEVVWKFSDPIVPVFFMAVRRIESGDGFEMVEESRRMGQERRLILKASNLPRP